MNNRITNSTPASSTQFGLMAWLEQTRISLPLKGVECRFTVCGDLLNVEIDQIFHQNSSQPLDCVYTFPLPASAAVYRCEMQINQRIIRAKVEEVGRAREIVREKKAAGHRTALVEMERDNLFTLSLGNVQPEDLIVVRFAYFQTLTRLADWTSFSVPFCPGVRYIPGTPLLRSPSGRGVADDTDQVPDAGRISPPRIDRLHADAAYLFVEGEVEHPLGNVRDISSPSHPVLVRDGKLSSTVTIADHAAVPDCDFVMRWTEANKEQVQPIGWVSRHENESFALVRLQAPSSAEVDSTYEQDVYFLIDRSGSMEGLKWEKAVQAFLEFVKRLGPKDRVWATFFDDAHRDIAEKPLAPAKLLRDRAVLNIASIGVGGGTELLPALEHVLAKIATHSTDRPVSLLLITDGQVGNEAEILGRLEKHTSLRVHTFGIDTAVNDGFLQKMASAHRGTCYLLSPQDDIAGAVARLGERLRQPVLTSICIEGGWESANPKLPDLHAGEIVSWPLKGNTSAREVVLRGKLHGGATKTFRFELSPKKSPALPLLWAKQRMDHHLVNRESNQAIQLGKKFNLICEGAAFVAWDEAEKVALSGPEREVYQPAMEVRMLLGQAYGLRANANYCGSLRSSDSEQKLNDRDIERCMARIFPRRWVGAMFTAYSWQAEFFRELESLANKQDVQRKPIKALRQLLEALRDACLPFFETKLMRSSEGWEFLKVLCEWVIADLVNGLSQIEKLERLQLEFQANEFGLAETATLGSAWLEANLKNEPVFKQRAEKKLKALLAATPKP